MKKKRSNPSQRVPSGTPGRAGGQNASGTGVVPVAARTARNARAKSAGKSAPASGTADATPGTNGNTPATIPPRGKTPRRGPDSIDWRYLTPDQWKIVDAGLYYFLSSFVSADSRAPIETIIANLARQEPTV